jgi:tripartite-type tricarboxylate transporter receptor subunit TctC
MKLSLIPLSAVICVSFGMHALTAPTTAKAADAYPNKPIRLVVNTAPGGWTDVTTRYIAQKMSEKLGEPILVDNRAGADGLVGIRYVKSAPKDGYTILASAGTIAIQPSVKQEPGYDLPRDFVGIGPMARTPLVMIVGAGQPDKSLKDFVNRAKASPNKLTYGSAGVGSTTHLGAAMFMRESGLSLLHVPYKGNGAAMPDVLGGRLDTIFEAYGSSAGNIKGGAVRALGVTSSTRLAALPNVPTLAEQGYKDFSYYLYIGMVAPAGTPKAAIQKLSDALRTVTQSEEVKAKLKDEGSEPMTMSSDEFTVFLRKDMDRMSRLVEELHIPKL